jgi:5-oxoprolinase (ATP-hydrolysing) subunit A
MKTIEINCDLGESFGVYKLGQDAEIMTYITSANIACGFHAGDPRVMAQTVQLAKKHGVAVGAHPGYPDLVGFGRRDMAMLFDEIEAMLLYQIGALAGICRAEGVDLVHVKPHGALYNKAAKELSLAKVIAQSVYKFNKQLILVGLAGSRLVEAGESAGLKVFAEGFADRVYEPDGSLRPRNLPGAMIIDPKEVARHGLELAKNGVTALKEGKTFHWEIQTICLHGDEPGAVENARALKRLLKTQNN